MSLPQPTDYDEAIQNSRISFIDSELKNAINDGPIFMGVPGGPVASGNFAIVYRFRTNSRKIAVKCFTREKSDQQIRYQAIHEHLRERNLPWMIDFAYLKDGIRIKGKVYPILKMEWLENAKSLNSYISSAILSNKSIDFIRDQFYAMMVDLKNHSIAHGDLQHGNIIISDDKLRLIDYDCMCVPKTVGMRSEEDGLPDYQHPLRNGGKLNYSTDHFSALVIWASLQALSIKPDLWHKWVGDQERLLFSKSDFINPKGSNLINELKKIGDKNLNLTLDAIVRSSGANLNSVPHINDIVLFDRIEHTGKWWEAESDVKKIKAPPKPLPDWLDPIKSSAVEPVNFRGNNSLCVICTGLSIAASIFLFLFAVTGLISMISSIMFSCLFLIANFTLLKFSYDERPEVKSKKIAQENLLRAKSEQAKSKNNIEPIQYAHISKINEIKDEIQKHEDRIKNKLDIISKIDQKRQQKLKLHEIELARIKLDSENKMRDAKNIHNESAYAAKKHRDKKFADINKNHSVNLATIEREIASLISEKKNEHKKRFFEKYGSFITSELSKIDISQNNVKGVNVALLRKHGFNTLSDFSGHVGNGLIKHKNGKQYKIDGIGEVRADQLVLWRKYNMDQICTKIPYADKEKLRIDIDAIYNIKNKKLKEKHEAANKNFESQILAADNEYKNALSSSLNLSKKITEENKKKIESLPNQFQEYKNLISREDSSEYEKCNRELSFIRSVIEPLRHSLFSEEESMRQKCQDLMQVNSKCEISLSHMEAEYSRYAKINFAHFIGSIFS
jgi:hypothetical protein